MAAVAENVPPQGATPRIDTRKAAATLSDTAATGAMAAAPSAEPATTLMPLLVAGANSVAHTSGPAPPAGSGTSDLQARFAAFKGQRRKQRQKMRSTASSASARAFRGVKQPRFTVGTGNGCVMAADYLEGALAWRRVPFAKVRAQAQDAVDKATAATTSAAAISAAGDGEATAAAATDDSARGTERRGDAARDTSTESPTVSPAPPRVRRGPAVALKWVEYPRALDFKALDTPAFATSLLNHIRGIRCLTDKGRLLTTLREGGGAVDMATYVPQTFDLSDTSQRAAFAAALRATLASHAAPSTSTASHDATTVAGDDTRFYLLKPPAGSKGKGIRLVRASQALAAWAEAIGPGITRPIDTTRGGSVAAVATPAPHAASAHAACDYIAQRYLAQPLLLDGRKFDVRVFLLVTKTDGRLRAWYHDGYMRLAVVPYGIAADDGVGFPAPPASDAGADVGADTDAADGAGSDVDGVSGMASRYVHLTNVSIQKHHPDYEAHREEHIWTMAQLGTYVAGHVGELELDGDAVSTASGTATAAAAVEALLRGRLQGVMRSVIASAARHLRDGPDGCFQLLGFDFLVDRSLAPWLLEVNRNPDLEMHCDTLGRLLPPMLSRALDLVLASHDTPPPATMAAVFPEGLAGAGEDGERSGRFELLFEE